MRVAEIGPADVGEQRHKCEAHAERLGALGEEVRSAAATPAEREIRATDEVLRAETLMEDLGHEGLGRHQAEVVVEAEFVEQRHAESRQGVGALGRQREAERRVVRAEMLAGVRLEGEHRERLLRAGGMGGVDHVGVAAMHAIEIAQCDGRAAGVGGKLAPVMEDADHGREGTWT